MTDMGTFRTEVEIESAEHRGPRRALGGMLVDTGSELTWVPAGELEALGITPARTMRFRQATGTVVERRVGFAIVHVGGTSTADDIVFAEPGDLSILGARTLEGLNVAIDPVSKRLVDAGPMLGAAVA